jgi:hypothetical protein
VSAVLVIGGSERAERLGPREEWGSPGWARESGGAAARDSGWDLAICFDEHKFRFCHYWHIICWLGPKRKRRRSSILPRI